ncbi:uncharacterized protein LOC143268196 [Peromyscus maniculatus bairdii]|uniref:uncharacterized protein LOC143268196 n=1 Tax=Peromyscus maniculatus bairdii TaxID=230844 RepID=UPI003FD10CD4
MKWQLWLLAPPTSASQHGRTMLQPALGTRLTTNSVTPEHQVATPSSTDVQKSPSSLTKVDPGKDGCVPEYNLLEKNHQQQHMVASEKAEVPEVQADTSGHVPSTEREGTVEMH